MKYKLFWACLHLLTSVTVAHTVALGRIGRGIGFAMFYLLLQIERVPEHYAAAREVRP